MRRRSVGAFARHIDAERLAAGCARAVEDHGGADGIIGLHMDAEDGVGSALFGQQGAHVVAHAHFFA